MLPQLSSGTAASCATTVSDYLPHDEATYSALVHARGRRHHSCSGGEDDEGLEEVHIDVKR